MFEVPHGSVGIIVTYRYPMPIEVKVNDVFGIHVKNEVSDKQCIARLNDPYSIYPMSTRLRSTGVVHIYNPKNFEYLAYKRFYLMLAAVTSNILKLSKAFLLKKNAFIIKMNIFSHSFW